MLFGWHLKLELKICKLFLNFFKKIFNFFIFSGLEIKTQIFPGGTDSRYIRQVGIPAIGFSPMNNTPVLLHDHDEFLKADTYLNGIEIYKTLIPKVANV